VTASDIESAHLHKLAIQNARETVLLIDHSKLYVPSLYKITDIGAISRVVTDRQPDEEWLEFFAEKKIEVLYPHDAASNEAVNRRAIGATA
jgi:DeoR/GlpR family transcriptional regulator of sugar metabolism